VPSFALVARYELLVVFVEPAVCCVRTGLSLPFEQSLTLVLCSCCLATASCSDVFFVPVSSLCFLHFFAKFSFSVQSSPLCVADVDTGTRHSKMFFVHDF